MQSAHLHESVDLLSLQGVHSETLLLGPVSILSTRFSPEIHGAAAVHHNAAIYNSPAQENRGWPFLEHAGAV